MSHISDMLHFITNNIFLQENKENIYNMNKSFLITTLHLGVI